MGRRAAIQETSEESSSEESVESVRQVKTSGSGNAASSVQSMGLSVGMKQSEESSSVTISGSGNAASSAQSVGLSLGIKQSEKKSVNIEASSTSETATSAVSSQFSKAKIKQQSIEKQKSLQQQMSLAQEVDTEKFMTPVLERAMENTKLQSNLGYQKQKAEAIEQHRGFQNLDASQHPVVQQHKKASELQSVKAYTDEWDQDKQMIYYPAHLTPTYDA